jgi:uncharacterized protein with ParB-like and HNH nuclease domain
MSSSYNDIRCISVTLGELFNGFLNIRPFHRGTEWNEEQVTELLNCIAGESDGVGPYDERWIGMILTKLSSSNDGREDVLDGQQRILTVFLTYCALARVIDLLTRDSAGCVVNRLRLARQAIMDRISKLNDHYIGSDQNPIQLRLHHNDGAMHAYICDLVAKLDEGIGNCPTRSICNNLHKKYCQIYTWLDHYLKRQEPELSATRLLSLFRDITHKTYILKVVSPDTDMASKIYKNLNKQSMRNI